MKHRILASSVANGIQVVDNGGLNTYISHPDDHKINFKPNVSHQLNNQYEQLKTFEIAIIVLLGCLITIFVTLVSLAVYRNMKAKSMLPYHSDEKTTVHTTNPV